MNSEKLNSWLSIAANLGVLIGIVFLAAEIRQNTHIMEAQTRDSISQKQIDWFIQLGTDAESIENVLSRGQDYQELDPNESLAFNFLMQANFRMWENEFYQYQMGLFEENEFLPRVERWKAVLGTSGRQFVWDIVRNGYSPDFVTLIDRLIEDTRNE